MSTAHDFRKGDCVFYSAGSDTVRARVECRHRDGSLTIGALFFVDEHGADRPPYLGYKYRQIDAALLRRSA